MPDEVDIPRRSRLDLNTYTELLIREAITSVEGLGADPRLTTAVTLMSEALGKVADVIDERLGEAR
ncbi:hypothetical protein [Rhodoplanes roseus]|nr:hypothetical protein [Rhodoplanes roseus]